MKHNRLLFRAAALLGVLTLLSSAVALSGGTVAKYASMGSGSATGSIASWAVSAGNVSASKVWYDKGSRVNSDPTVTITNNSDVETKFSFEFEIIDSLSPTGTKTGQKVPGGGDGIASVSASGGGATASGLTVTVPAHAATTVTINTNATTQISSTDKTGAYRKFEMKVFAMQVD